MNGLKFSIIRLVANIIFCMLMFYGFLCGIHYGTELIGMYFLFVKVLLGILGVTAILFVTRGAEQSLLYLIKNASIYSQCKDVGVVESFRGIFVEYKSTISVTVLNKLIRESLEYLQELIEKQKNPGEGEQVGVLEGVLEELGNTELVKAGKFVLKRALDYVDECVLGYCYKNVSDEKSLTRCCLEGFTLFCVNCIPICKKMISVIMVQLLVKITYWVVFVMFCVKTFEFSVMNLILCYVIGKLLDFVLEDSLYEPALMLSIVKQFSEYEWKEDFEDKLNDLVGKIPAIGKIQSYCKGGASSETISDFDSASNDAFQSTTESENGGNA